MAIELIKKPITLDEMSKKESIQVVKERDMIVPDGKPDMQNVVQVDGKICIDQIDVTQDRVMYRGKINVCILYNAVNNPKCIYTMKGSIPIEDFVIVEGINKDQRVDFNYELEHMSHNILNERKINVKAIMQIDVQVTGCKEATIITDINTEGSVQTKKEQIEIVSLGNEQEEKTIVKEDLTVASSKPCIGEILKSYLQIQEEQVKRMETEIRYNGIIEVTTMYKVVGDSDEIAIVSHRVPFEGSMENMKGDQEAFWDCKLSVEPSYMQVTPDYDGEDRIIESEFIVTAKYNNFNKSDYETIVDLYCPGQKVNTKEKSLEYMNLKDRQEVAVPKKEAISIEGIVPENAEVFSVEIKPSIEERNLEDNLLIIKGMLEFKITCLANDEEKGSMINTFVNVVPFTQELEVNCSTGKAYIEPYVTTKDVKVYAQTKRELVVEYLLDCIAEVYKKEIMNIVEEVALEDISKEELEQYPSMTVYQVKKNDTLWELAKRFNTTVKDIQEINDIDTPENLREGQKIIILKKVKF